MNYKYDFKSVRRVTKRVARRLYDKGIDVLFIPCKCNPERDVWGLSIWENKELWGQLDSFDAIVNAYTDYNCNYELGKYIAFYIKKEGVLINE